MEATIKVIRDKLETGGFSGLYCEGECGCGIDDLAPCGECSLEDYQPKFDRAVAACG